MVANWYPAVQRTPGGFYKNISLSPTTDPFTGQQVGTQLPTRFDERRKQLEREKEARRRRRQEEEQVG